MGLKESGINLMPENCDADPTQCTLKSPDTVERAYSDLAEIASLYDIAYLFFLIKKSNRKRIHVKS